MKVAQNDAEFRLSCLVQKGRGYEGSAEDIERLMARRGASRLKLMLLRSRLSEVYGAEVAHEEKIDLGLIDSVLLDLNQGSRQV